MCGGFRGLQSTPMVVSRNISREAPGGDFARRSASSGPKESWPGHAQSIDWTPSALADSAALRQDHPTPPARPGFFMCTRECGVRFDLWLLAPPYGRAFDGSEQGARTHVHGAPPAPASRPVAYKRHAWAVIRTGFSCATLPLARSRAAGFAFD